MNPSFRAIALALAACASLPILASAAPLPEHAQAEAQALDLAKQAIALRSVAGPGNKTGEVAALFRDALVAAGFDSAAITITPYKDTAYLIATWKGSDPDLKPLVISGHMDVVEARPEDWKRDPFSPVVENGFLYGRGALDMKLDDSLALATLIELKREGYAPRRSIVVALSGDEETAMATSELIALQLKGSELVLNVDGGGGTLDEASGKPLRWSIDGAEKVYADFTLTATNPGGHSSKPRPDNAIDQLAGVLIRIAQHRFKPELNAISRVWFTESARLEPDAAKAAAMRAFAADPSDAPAIATLAADPETVGKIGTTCVVTMISGGHALNALPQRATANINCRIFPGHDRAEIMAELKRVAAEPAVMIADITAGSVASPPSPLRPDVTAAIDKALHSIHPGVPIIPVVASGASDSMWYRADGVPSYGVSPVFIKDSDSVAHGLDERVPLDNVRAGIDYHLILLTELSR